MNSLEEKVANSLLAARQDAHLSLRQLAERAGTSHSTLLAYEKGKKIPSAATYFRILEACGNAIDIVLHRRVREADGLARGEELNAVLDLADQFPHRASRYLDLPIFGSSG